MGKLRNYIFTGSVIVTLSGCATFGESEYSCPGRPDGARCMSVKEVYEATENSDFVSHTGSTNNQGKQTIENAHPGEDARVKPAYRSPQPGATVPIRTPSGVIRIWIDAYEDTNEFLHGAQYVFAEVEKRRWVIGTPYEDSRSPLSPLRAIQKPK